MKYLSCSILLFFLSSFCYSEDPDSIDYRLNMEFERLVTTDSSLKVQLTTDIAQWYIAEGAFQQALQEMKDFRAPLTNHINEEFQLTFALSAFYADSFELCLRLLDSSGSFNNNMGFEASILKIYALNYSGRWEESREWYNSLAAFDAAPSVSIDSLYNEMADLKLKNPKTAKILSSILPGLGQTYAGKPGKGIISLLLTGSCIAYAAAHYSLGFYWTGTLTGIGFFLRFYQGGRTAAFRYAYLHKQETIRRFASNLSKKQHEHFAVNSENINLLKH